MKEDLSPPTAILVVDDDPTVRRVFQLMLSRMGHSPALAEDAGQGIAFASEHSRSLRLAIVDYILPDMDGITCIQRLGSDFPNLRFILTSGYSMELTSVLRNLGVIAVLEKPFMMDDLKRVLAIADFQPAP